MQKSRQILVIILLVMVLMLSVSCTNASNKATTETVGQNENENVNVSVSVNENGIDSNILADISSDKMIETIKLLASTDNARVTGFEGESSAASYIVDQFKGLGMTTEEQSFPVKAYAALNTALEIVSSDSQPIEEAKALSYSLGTSTEGITAELVDVGLGASEDYTDKDVTGKYVLISRGGEFFYLKADRAAQKGAAGVIFYDPASEGAISATLTHLSKIPAVSIGLESAKSLIESLSSGEVVTMNLKMEIVHKDATSVNISSVYPSANNPEGKVVIVGAHYDGVDTPAANDNASGASVILEIARILNENKVELPFDVKFVAFGAEEIGLVGSNYYTNHMKTDEKKAAIAMLNFDMVGVGDTYEISTAGGADASDLVTITTDTLKQMGLPSTVSEKENSDHTNFSYTGIPAILIEAGPFHDYHTDKDTVEGIQTDVIKNSCELGLKLLIEGLPKQFK